VGAVLDDVVVVEVASGMVGSLITMLLGDYGARVIKVERPGGDPLRHRGPGSLVWDRNKESVELDLTTPDGSRSLEGLVGMADVVVETFAPGVGARLGIDLDRFRAADPRLVTCSVTGYGRTGTWASRPGWDALVQARSGIAAEQPAWLRGGPTFMHTPLPSYGAFYLASCGINAALWGREVTGTGRHVETSLMQGAILWTTMLWTRAERPTPDLTTTFKFRDLMPTPTYGTSDGWIHAMPNGIALGQAHFGFEDPDLDPSFAMGDHDTRRRYQDAVERLFRSRRRDEWLELLWANEVSAQPCLAPGESHSLPQVIHNRVVTEVEIEGYGPTRQLGHPYHLERSEERPTNPPPPAGRDTGAVLQSLAQRAPRPPAAAAKRSLAGPLDGVRCSTTAWRWPAPSRRWSWPTSAQR